MMIPLQTTSTIMMNILKSYSSLLKRSRKESMNIKPEKLMSKKHNIQLKSIVSWASISLRRNNGSPKNKLIIWLKKLMSIRRSWMICTKKCKTHHRTKAVSSKLRMLISWSKKSNNSTSDWWQHLNLKNKRSKRLKNKKNKNQQIRRKNYDHFLMWFV